MGGRWVVSRCPTRFVTAGRWGSNPRTPIRVVTPVSAPRRSRRMTWIRTHWLAIAVAGALFVVGVAVGALGGLSESTTQTRTVAKTQIKTVVPAEDFRGKRDCPCGHGGRARNVPCSCPHVRDVLLLGAAAQLARGQGGHRHRLRDNRPGNHQGRPERLRGCDLRLSDISQDQVKGRPLGAAQTLRAVAERATRRRRELRTFGTGSSLRR